MSSLLSPREYLTSFDSSDIPTVSSAWTLTSPNATVWGPSISTSGVITMTSGATAGTSAVFIGLDGNKWTPTIANTGVITLTSGGALSASDNIATIVDADGVAWVLYVDDLQVTQVTTASVLPSLLRYPALIVTYTPSAGTDMCLLHSLRVDLTQRFRQA